MHLFSWKNSKFKILGITIFKIKNTSSGICLYMLGIPCYKHKGKLSKLVAEIRKNKNFNTQEFDKKIEYFIKPINVVKMQKNNNNIGFLATEIYDRGGHTKCIKDLILSLSNKYQQFLFLTQKSSAPNILGFIKDHINIYGIDANLIFFRKNVKRFCDKIISTNIKTLLVYIHPDDIFGTAVLAYLKNATNIKIIYFNHASHFPSLGMSFADVILEGMPTTEKVTNEKRGFSNTKIIGLQSLAKGDTKYFSKDELNELKSSIGISKDNLVTMSGASSYKFFDNNDSSYFKMIKNLLKKEPKLTHVIISEFNDKQKNIIENIFENAKDIRNRLIFVPYQTDFDKYFQMTDVFIDSFPVSSALTQIDLMRNKVASVVKINKETPEFSFHEYQMPNYPYMFEKVEDMEVAVLELLYNERKRQDIIEKNYEFWLKTYESSIVRDKYIKIIEDTESKIELINFLDISEKLQMETRNWRNSSEVSPYFKIKEIDVHTHKQWLHSLQVENPKNIAFMIKYDNKFIGVTYFHSIDYGKSCADWGMYIYISEFKGKGIGFSVLQKCNEYAFNTLKLHSVFLDVLDTNQRAINLYEKIGFKCIGKNNNFYRYEYCLK